MNDVLHDALPAEPLLLYRFRENGSFDTESGDESDMPALKEKLQAGWKPVIFGRTGCEDRWSAVLEKLGVDAVEAYYKDGSFYKKLNRTGLVRKVRIGVMGAGRGKAMMRYCSLSENAELVAVCDKYERRLQEVREGYGKDKDIAYFTDFEEFIKYDMDCVVLANYANQHAPFAVKCLKAGKHVISECLPAQHLKEAVELVEAAEEAAKKGVRYFFAEDYCYYPSTKKMKEMAEEGLLGEVEYAEGEYMHRFTPRSWGNLTFADRNHWRNRMSAFFYCTHSVGPMVHIAGSRPVKVVGIEGPYTKRTLELGASHGAFGVEIITLENGAVLKSLHGCGATRKSVYYSFYGEKGRLESARADAGHGYTRTLYGNVCNEDKKLKEDPVPTRIETADRLSEIADHFNHSGADFYMMLNIVQAIRGDKNADIVDVYEAMDMWLPGMFAYRSVLAGGIPMEVPDFRKPEDRDKWRNDTSCTDPAAAGDMLQPTSSHETPEIPQTVYDAIYQQAVERDEPWTKERPVL